MNSGTSEEGNPVVPTGYAGHGASASAHFQTLPEAPLVVIDPSKSGVSLDLRALWTYRELLYFLTWRDVKIRYKQTVLGIAWAVLQPLLMMLVFSLFFGRIAGIPSDGVPYPVFAFAGLLPWTFFSNTTINSGNSLVFSAHLITKVYFPRMMIPAAAVGAGIVDLVLSLPLMVPLMAYYKIVPTWHLLALPLFIVLAVLLALGMGLWMAALNVKYRDIRFALPFMIQLWMFISPVIYPSSQVKGPLRKIISINPMTGIIEGFRSSLFGLPFNWADAGVSVILTIALLVFATYSFRKLEKSFADII